MTRAVSSLAAAALLCTSLVLTAPAAAQGYESNLRFGLGLDYAGLFGRDDGAAGGLRLSLGARVHEHAAIYYQGQALGGLFVGDEEATGMFLGWNAVIAEASYGIFQVGAGPSLDVAVVCESALFEGQVSSASCATDVAPGLATRAGVRFGIFVVSVDLHATFPEGQDPTVWGLVGIGVQLGDVATGPMLFPSSEPRAREEDEYEPVDVAPLERELPADESRAPSSLAAMSPATMSPGRRLADPCGTGCASAPSEAQAERGAAPERSRAPTVRRFSRRDVRVSRAPARDRAREQESRETERPMRDELQFEGSDDPIEGLEGR